MKMQSLKLSNLYKFVNDKNDKVKAKLLIGLNYTLHQFDQMELDNQIFTGALKFNLKNSHKALEKTFNTYYTKDKKELNYVQSDNMNDGELIIENAISVAFQLSERPIEEVEKFQTAYYKLLQDFNIQIK
jgi:hypothetical protein